MKPTFILNEILSRQFRSISWITKIEMPAIDLEYDRRLDLFSQDAWRVARKLAAGFPNEAARKSIPVCHATYLDGSEQDLWAHFALQDQAFLLIEVSHSYIDHHFVSFKLWDTDQGAEREYPIDRLFQEEFFGEESSEHRKIGEIFVRPVTVAIHASKFNPSNLMPEENEIERMVKPVEGFPLYKFWRDFESGDYTQAANMLFILLDQLAKKQDSIDGYVSFVRSVYAVCKYQAGEYELAAELFMSSGKEYLQLGLLRNADACLFYALEAGKKIIDVNKAFLIAKKVADCLQFLNGSYKIEILAIIKSYYSWVYIGTAALCRRIIELFLSEKLETRFGVPIKKQIQTAKKNGEIGKNIGPGLYGILELAKLRGIISNDEYILASNIKDFGNKIHEKGGIKNYVDAKYALQSCLHLLHRM